MNPCYSCWANETVEYQLLFIHKINAQLQLDLNKHNDQYPPIEARTYKSSHDRFLIIDNTEVYHIGASLKDLGKKMFAFSKLELPAHTIIDVLWNKLITHARSGREFHVLSPVISPVWSTCVNGRNGMTSMVLFTVLHTGNTCSTKRENGNNLPLSANR